jgi:hypothetical protein
VRNICHVKLPGNLARAARSLVVAATVLAVAAATLTGPVAAQAAPPPATRDASSAARVVPAADLSQFRPGNIVSDVVFYDSTTMSSTAITDFLRQKVPTCQAGYTCLKDYWQATPTRPADAYCAQYSGSNWESSASIIQKVAQACGINPQVLLVTLQKEQGLVTHTWPSEFRYTAAMGQGCPDTAACDTRYYGFFNQVYGAARQFKIYGQSTYFTWYAPGKTWNVLYHPNRSCGSSPVLIQNQATANLYYYTPYQPNGPALQAGYGEGDGCSSYGNRNFYNYFTDWFGSAQQPVSSLVRSPAGDVYYLSYGEKHHVPTEDDYRQYRMRYGVGQQVSSSFLDLWPTGAPAKRYVHDAAKGDLYFLQDGTLHWFSSSTQVAQYGYQFASYLNMEPGQVAAFGIGAPVGDFLHDPAQGRVYERVGDQKRWIYDEVTFAARAAGRSAFAGEPGREVLDGLRTGTPIIATGTLVKEPQAPEVYAVTDDATMIHIDSFATAAEYRMTRSITVPTGTLNGFTKQSGDLSIFATCGGRTYVVGSGVKRLVTTMPSGFTATTVADGPCGGLVTGSAIPSTRVFAQFGSDSIYTLEDGRFRHVASPATYQRLLAGARAEVVVLTAPSASAVRYGAPVVLSGEFVQFDDSGAVFREEGGRLRGIPTYQRMLDLNGGTLPSILRVQSSFRSSYTFGPNL